MWTRFTAGHLLSSLIRDFEESIDRSINSAIMGLKRDKMISEYDVAGHGLVVIAKSTSWFDITMIFGAVL